MLEAIQKHWWYLLIRGILILLFGLFALFSPGAVLVSLLLYLGIVAFLGGIFTIVGSIFSKDEGKMSGILEGLLYLILGILFMWAPGFLLASIVYFIAIWALISGIMQIVYAIKLRKIIENEWIAIVGGVISIIFALILFFNVVASANALVMTLGVFAIISGILQIMLSFKIKGLKKIV
jgi:uncharacterized membrane protein HdeD (DUF308 family)